MGCIRFLYVQPWEQLDAVHLIDWMKLALYAKRMEPGCMLMHPMLGVHLFVLSLGI